MAAPRLSETRIKNAGPGRHSDGGRAGYGLYILVQPNADGGLRRSFCQRLRIQGRVTNLGLGPWPLVTLAEAREKAFDNKRVAYRGGNPKVDTIGTLGNMAGVVSHASVENAPTLADCLDSYMALKAQEFRGGTRTAHKWRATFDNHAASLMSRPVNLITTADVSRALGKVWYAKPGVAKELRQRLSAVLRWAVSQGHIPADPVAAAVAGMPKAKNGNGRMESVPHAKVAGALAQIRGASEARESSRLVMEYLILTATRSGEARGAQWGEIDGDVWSIPGERTKTGNAQRVALSKQALAVLDRAAEHTDRTDPDALIFVAKTGGEIGPSTLATLCRRADVGGSPHGFRASFRSWAADNGIDRDVAEMALGHVVAGVEGRYQRSDLLERRRDVMEAWGAYVAC